MNDNLDSPAPVYGPVSVQADHVDGGWGAGAGLRFWLAEKMCLQFTGEYLSAGTDGAGSYLGVNYTGDLNVSALAFTAALGRTVLQGAKARAGAMAGAGIYTTIGDLEVRSATFQNTTDIQGRGLGFYVATTGEYSVSPGVALDASLGYRFASTASVQGDGGADLLNADGSKSNIDWGGPYLRLGFAFYPKRSN